MLAFRIALNDGTPVTAGIEGPHVVSVIACSVVREDVAPDNWPAGKRFRRREVDLHVGGLVTSERAHVDWLKAGLKVGDRISIEVIDTSSVDTPRRRRFPKAKATNAAASRATRKHTRASKQRKPLRGRAG